jgi:ribosomal protein S27E
MLGRNGPDHLSVAMLITSVALNLLARVPFLFFLTYLAFALLVFTGFRILSRNIPARRRENDKYLKYWWPIKTKLRRFFTGLKDRKNHKFFKCPSCHNTLRVPKGKGKLQITCPKCGERFVKKT